VTLFRRYIATRLSELEVDAESIGRDLFATRARSWEVRIRLTANPPDIRVRTAPNASTGGAPFTWIKLQSSARVKIAAVSFPP